VTGARPEGLTGLINLFLNAKKAPLFAAGICREAGKDPLISHRPGQII